MLRRLPDDGQRMLKFLHAITGLKGLSSLDVCALCRKPSGHAAFGVYVPTKPELVRTIRWLTRPPGARKPCVAYCLCDACALLTPDPPTYFENRLLAMAQAEMRAAGIQPPDVPPGDPPCDSLFQYVVDVDAYPQNPTDLLARLEPVGRPS